MRRRSFTQEFKRQAGLLVLNEGLPVQTVSKNGKSIPIPSIDEFRSMNNMKNVPFL